MSALESESLVSSPGSLLLPSPAQHLYSDAILSILQFLALPDMIAAHSACCSWRTAAHRAPSRKVTLRCASSGLAGFAGSAFRHHVAAYEHLDSRDTIGFDGLRLLCAFPGLVSVRARFDDAALTSIAAADSVAGFPSKLTTLDLQLATEHPSTVKTQRLLECMCQLTSLTSLRLAASLRPNSLHPLLLLPHLHDLTLVGFEPDNSEEVEEDLVNADLAILKQLSSLERLSVNEDRWTASELNRLCSPPHALNRLHTLEMRWTTLSPAHMESLLKLPALTSIHPYFHEAGTTPYLPQFPCLRSLDLWRSSDAQPDFMHDLKQCSGLTRLSLWHCAITAQAFAELCSSLSALTKLTLFGVTDLGLADSESALRCVTSLSQLETLQIHQGTAITLAHIRHADLAQLKALRHLSISLEHEIEEARALLQPPSVLLPQLATLRIGSEPRVAN